MACEYGEVRGGVPNLSRRTSRTGQAEHAASVALSALPGLAPIPAGTVAEVFEFRACIGGGAVSVGLPVVAQRSTTETVEAASSEAAVAVASACSVSCCSTGMLSRK